MWVVSSVPADVYHEHLDVDIHEGVAKPLFDASIIESYKCTVNAPFYCTHRLMVGQS